MKEDLFSKCKRGKFASGWRNVLLFHPQSHWQQLLYISFIFLVMLATEEPVSHYPNGPFLPAQAGGFYLLAFHTTVISFFQPLLFFPPSKWFLFPISISTFISTTSSRSSLNPFSMTITQCCVYSAMLISFKINTSLGQTSFSVLLIHNTFFHTNNYIIFSATLYLLL